MTESVETDVLQDGTLSFCKQNGRPCQHPYCFCDKGTGLILDSAVTEPSDENCRIQPYDPQTW
jgi:hypothetical protein